MSTSSRKQTFYLYYAVKTFWFQLYRQVLSIITYNFKSEKHTKKKKKKLVKESHTHHVMRITTALDLL